VTLALLLVSGAHAQETRQPAPGIPSIERRVDQFIARLDAARKEQGVVGAAIVVADGDRIVRIAGLGARDKDTRAPVTEDTVFPMASVTKQFTAVAIALTVSEGKMRFEDHPRRFVPSFRLQDPEADARLDMIDLLAHRSGLDRSDFPWLMAPFTPQEMFELAYRAKPVAGLRERFHYNATMYALAGAAVASAQGTTYERFMTQRLLQPLGMTSSTLALDGLTSAANRATGYKKSAKGVPEAVKPIDLASIAPGGSLNSTARDMGAWLRFLNARGRIDGKTAIAPAVFQRLFERHQAIGPGYAHGLGFFLHAKDVLVAEHGGNVPGYTARVVHLPERGLSFALLTNQDTSQLGDTAQDLLLELVVAPEKAPPPVAGAAKTPPPATPPAAPRAAKSDPARPAQPIAAEEIVGSYHSTQAGDFEVKKTASGLVVVFPKQPPYPLVATEVDKYDLSGLPGFSVAFGKSLDWLPGRVTAFLRQPPSHPIGNVAFLKRDDAWLQRAQNAHGGPGKELIGLYRNPEQFASMEILPHQGGLALIITGNPPHPLKEIGADHYRLDGLPETFQVRIKRAGGGVAALVYEQPNMRLELASAAAPKASADDREARAILDKAVAAVGGTAALDRIETTTVIARVAAVTHGLDGRAESITVAGKKTATRIEIGAFGKTVWKLRSVTDEKRVLSVDRDGVEKSETGKSLESSHLHAVPHPLYRWKERFPTVALVGEERVNGEDAFVIELTPRNLGAAKVYVSKQSFLVLREEHPLYTGDELLPLSLSVDLFDHRMVGGLKLAHGQSFAFPGFGPMVINVDTIWLDKTIDPKVFELAR
jgi:CubicO group peptidase (beta-lactamase class C family)